MKKLKVIAETGFIAHNLHTGEEWLVCKDWEEWIYLGVGRTSDWENAEGVSYEEEIEFPGDNASTDIYPGYFQKNVDTLNPVNEFEGWEKHFEKIGDNYRYKNTY